MKSLYRIGDSLKAVKRFPPSVKQMVGYALYRAQEGDKHPDATPLKGFRGAGRLEVAADHHGDTYRAVYTVRFRDAVYVLHAFQKKSKRGIATPKQDIELVKWRLRLVQQSRQEA